MSEIVETVRAYDAWRIAREYEDDSDLPALYAKHLQIELDKRFLAAIRMTIQDYVNSDAREIILERLVNGDVDELEKVEASYEA